MKIVFVHVGIPFDGESLGKGPLGGTETALIGVSRELAKNPDNEIFIFTNTPEINVFDGVHYLPLARFAHWSQNKAIDVLISLRQWIPFWLPLKVKLRIYFSPDAYNQPFLQRAIEIKANVKGEDVNVPLFRPAEFFSNIDAFFCVGAWQAQTFIKHLGFPKDKMVVTANGVFLENFKPLALADRKPRLMYSSTPFRGLEHLVSYFPQIKNEFPQAELEVCSGMQVYGLSDSQDQEQYGALYRQLKSVGAISHGSITQSELAHIMCRNRVFTYPNTFEETFCITVLEAQAAGLPVVTSDKGALKERITHGVDGFLIKGEPSDEAYQKEFIDTTVQLLKDDELWQKISAGALKRAASQTYTELAKQWQVYFEQRVPKKSAADLLTSPALQEAHIVLPHKDNLTININVSTLQQFLKQAFAMFGF